MKIIVYCQHVLGVGHFFRTLEILKALSRFEVILVTGGKPVETPLPAHVRVFRLPALMMDAEFSKLTTTETAPVDAVKTERKTKLLRLFSTESPDAFLLELYPFGRKAFRFEIDPILQGAREGALSRCKIFCSLRDILVEKSDPVAYESRVVRILNEYFTAVFIHSDPGVIRLGETFSRISDIRPKIHYTGFVTQKPPEGARRRIRNRLDLADESRLIVASAGGGNVGYELLVHTAAAFMRLDPSLNARLQLFTGPFMEPDGFHRLQETAAAAGGRITVERFTGDFLSYLAAADLSVSMAGYNTTLNILAAGTPAILYPFPQNREQRMRALRLAPMGAFDVLSETDCTPDTLAGKITEMLTRPRRKRPDIDLEGAGNTARIIEGYLHGHEA